jgi:hypothetical protein
VKHAAPLDRDSGVEIDPLTMGLVVVGLLAFFWLVGTLSRRRPRNNRPGQEVDNAWPGQGSEQSSDSSD